MRESYFLITEAGMSFVPKKKEFTFKTDCRPRPREVGGQVILWSPDAVADDPWKQALEKQAIEFMTNIPAHPAFNFVFS